MSGRPGRRSRGVVFTRLGLSAVMLALLLVVGCAGKPRSDGGYYGGDRPPDKWAVDPDSVADAVPRREPLSATGNAPYTALGQHFQPLSPSSARGFVQRGIASWYGSKFHGRRTSSGEPYDQFAMTAAHPVLPLPSYVRVTNLDNGRSVVVRVNDRGPFLHKRIIDLSYLAAHKLDIASHGTGPVEVRIIEPDNGGVGVGVGVGVVVEGYAGDVAGTGGAANATAVAVAARDSRTNSRDILIQAGAFAHYDNANALRWRLRRIGYHVEITPPPASPQQAEGDGNRNGNSPPLLYRVRVGPFPSHIEADAAQRKLEAMLGHPVALVVK